MRKPFSSINAVKLPALGRERKTLRGEAARALFSKAKLRMGGFASRVDREPIRSASAGSGRTNDTAPLLRYHPAFLWLYGARRWRAKIGVNTHL